MRNECVREQELLRALHDRRWPDGADPSLRDHTADCASCSALLSIAAALLEDHRQLVDDAPVPSSAIVWWRAQMRSRREAAQKAAEPVSVAQGVAIACAAGITATAAGYYVPTFRKSIEWMTQIAGSWSGVSLPVDPFASPVVVGLIAGVALCALVAPVALYLTLRED